MFNINFCTNHGYLNRLSKAQLLILDSMPLPY